MVFFHLAFALVGVVTTLLGPLLPLVTRAWHLDDGQVGAMLGAQFLASVLGGLGSTALAHRFGAGRSLAAGFLLQACGISLLLTGVWPVLLLAPATWGLGLGLVVPEMNLLVAIVGGVRAASALALFNVMWSAGALAWSATVYLAGARVGPVPLATTVASLALLVALGFVAGLGPGRTTTQASSDAPRDRSPVPWGTAAAFASMLFLYGGVENSLGGWVASFVARLGPGAVAYGAAAPAAFYAALALGRLFTVGLLRALSERAVLVGGQVLAMLALTAMVAADSPLRVIGTAFVAGLGCAVIYPITAAAIARELGRRAPRIVGPLLTAGGMGSATFPLLVGLVSRRTGSLRSGLGVAVAAALALIALTVVVSRATVARDAGSRAA